MRSGSTEQPVGLRLCLLPSDFLLWGGIGCQQFELAPQHSRPVAGWWLAGAAQPLSAMARQKNRQLLRGTCPWEILVVCVLPLLRAEARLPKEGGGLSENDPATCMCSFLQDPKEAFPSFLASAAGSSQPGWSSAIRVLQMSCTELPWPRGVALESRCPVMWREDKNRHQERGDAGEIVREKRAWGLSTLPCRGRHER